MDKFGARLGSLIRCLPLASEEGDFHVPTARSEILAALRKIEDTAASEALLALTERLLLANRLLDEQALLEGFWRWASYPASLMGRSMLDVLSDEGGFLFPRGYWTTPENVDEQRGLLHNLEVARTKHRAGEQPRAIRHVYVAWGLVKVGDRFLLRTREDKKRPRVKQFVFPGGRFRPEDANDGEPLSCLLAAMEAGSWLKIRPHLEVTLHRELKEELGLYEDQYVSRPWVEVSPYREVEGAANRHGYTEYRFQLFQVQFGRDTLLQMYSEIARSPDDFIWLTAEEVCAQRSDDGRYTAYLDALVRHFGDDFHSALVNCPASFQEQDSSGEKESAVDIPVRHGELFWVGLTGSEQSVDVPLNFDEHSMLLGLACHAKSYASAEATARLPAGWVKLSEEQLQVCHYLCEKLNSQGFSWIEISDAGFARWRLPASETYLDASVFDYDVASLQINSKRWAELQISRRELKTLVGIFPEESVVVSLSKKLALSIEAVEDERVPEADDDIAIGDFKKSVREALDKPLQLFGLRKFVRAVPQGKRKKSTVDSKRRGTLPKATGEYAVTILRRQKEGG